MTALALQPKITGMDFWLGMTGAALPGRTGKDPVQVASIAGQVGVPPIQDKETVVIEIYHEAGAIMAGQAVGSELGLVLAHKSRGLQGMALDTVIQGKAQLESIDGRMATRTKEGCPAVIIPMALQAKAGVLEMIEPLPTQPDQRRPILGGMAGSTVW